MTPASEAIGEGIARAVLGRACRFLAALAVAIACAMPALPQGARPRRASTVGTSQSLTTPDREHGAITGRVTDQENTPVSGVQVRAEGGPRGTKMTVVTAHNGRYELVRIQPGMYKVTFIKFAFQVVVYPRVKVLPGKTVALNVVLKVHP